MNGSKCPAPDAAYPFTGDAPGGATQAEKDALKAHKAALKALEVQLCPEPSDPGTQPTHSGEPSCQDDPPDIRSTYATDLTDHELATINGLSMPTDPHGYDQKTYDEVKAEIGKEVSAVIDVHKQEVALHSALATIPNEVVGYRDKLIRDLEDAVPEGAESTTVEDASFGLKVAAFFVELVEVMVDLVAGPEAGKVVEEISAGLGLLASTMVFSGEAAEFGESKAGKPHQVNWKVEANEIVDDAHAQLQATIVRQDEMYDLIYGNWGMLAAYATNLKARSGEWNATDGIGSDVLQRRVASAAKLSLYRLTVPLRFDAAELASRKLPDPARLCFAARAGGHSDCAAFGADSKYSYAYNPQAGASVAQFKSIAVAAQPENKASTPLPEDLVKTMTGLGSDEPDLFLRWPFLRNAVVLQPPGTK